MLTSVKVEIKTGSYAGCWMFSFFFFFFFFFVLKLLKEVFFIYSAFILVNENTMTIFPPLSLLSHVPSMSLSSKPAHVPQLSN